MATTLGGKTEKGRSLEIKFIEKVWSRRVRVIAREREVEEDSLGTILHKGLC
jgi:hypothetical protein